MKVIQTAIEGVVILEPQIYTDERGYFFESFNQKEFNEKIRPIIFVQDNESESKYGVVRALHFQKAPFAQSKLVRCVNGEILDVAVDIRKGSPTFGKWVSCNLSADNHRMFFVPRGFAHGFSTLTNKATVLFKCDNFYNPSSEVAVAWNDPDLQIDWKVSIDSVILTKKDFNQIGFNNLNYTFDYYTDLYKC